jgi:hypothetical protein
MKLQSRSYFQQIMGISGTPVIWSGPPSCSTSADCSPSVLSPDGTFFSVVSQNDLAPFAPTSNIYQNGTLVGAVDGNATGWIDDGHLFVQNYAGLGPTFTGIGIYNPSGTQLTSYPANTIPAINYPQFLAGNLVLNPAAPPAIYSLNDGSLVWAAPQGAGSGNNVAASVWPECGCAGRPPGPALPVLDGPIR